MSTNKKAMLFIGNGYDVALGYDTKYSNFYNNSILLKQYADCGNNLCKHIINNLKGDLWKDLECGLYQYSLSLTRKFGIGNENVARDFQKEFNELKNALFEYLKKEIQKPVSASSVVKSLLPIWNKLDFQCVSFNYTMRIAADINEGNARKCYNPDNSINTNILICRHGSLYDSKKGCDCHPEDIVVGIDDSQKVDELHSFLYKSQQSVQYQMRDLINDMNSKDVYIVYGCSMGDSDKCYFEKLFNPRNEGKCYILYGKGSINSMKNSVRKFVGDMNDFAARNYLYFLDCSDDPNTIQQTKDIIGKIVK